MYTFAVANAKLSEAMSEYNKLFKNKQYKWGISFGFLLSILHLMYFRYKRIFFFFFFFKVTLLEKPA